MTTLPDSPAEAGADELLDALGQMPPATLITLDGLARIFGRDTRSIRRAIDRGEIPPPVDLLNKKRWTVRYLLRHFEQRLEAAAEERAGQLEADASSRGKVLDLRP